MSVTEYEPVERSARILTLDIETCPNVVYSWGLYNQDHGLSQIIERGRMICYAAKWYGTKPILFQSEYHDGTKEMLDGLYSLLNEADIVIGWNSDKFDLPTVNREFILNDLDPVTPYRSIDLLKTAKGQFRFVSNKLDNVVQELGLGAKIKHQGQELWNACMDSTRPDEQRKAWNLMRRYNRHDVEITEAAYTELRPWIKNHPPVTLYSTGEGCSRCGSMDLVPVAKPYTTQVSSFQQFRCAYCGGFQKASRRLAGTTTRSVS